MNFNEKKTHILEVAEKLFASKGYDGTSIRDIAEEAGVNIAMISYYFGSKEKLIQALFQERSSHIKFRLESLLKDDSKSPVEKVWMLIDDYVGRLAEKQLFYRIMVYEQILQKNPVITDMLNDLKCQNATLIEQIIKDGIDKNVFKKDVDVVMLMNTMVGITMQTFLSKEYYKTYNNLQNLTEEEYLQVLKEKISNHIKVLFKALLSYES